MTDHHALVAKLHALARDDTPFIGGAKVICSGGSPDPVSAVLAEIDLHVLARDLTFDIDGQLLRLVVAGRRLCGLRDPDDTAAGVKGKMLSPGDPVSLHAIGRLLQDLCRNARQITVHSAPAADPGNPADLGVTAAALAKLWQADPLTEQSSPMLQFLSGDPDLVTDFLHLVSGEVVTTKGDATALQQVWQDQALALLARHHAIFTQEETPLLICLDSGDQRKPATAMAILGVDAAVFFYRPGRISRILTIWQMITR